MSDKDKYTKEREAGGCESCGHGVQYAVVFDIGGTDEIQESSTYEDEDFADDLVEMLNIAYSRGLATERAAHAEELRRVEQESVESYFIRQSEWSERTFGPGTRTEGIIAHIRKELDEVLAKPHDLEEWIDLIMLAMDGFWRHGGNPRSILSHLNAKQKKNFSRKWNVPQDGQPVEHVREPSEQAKGGDL